jgi:NTE family protein
MAQKAGRRRLSRRRERRVGIALGAGGARGLAHVGVLRTLDEAGVRIDAVVGTSIGSVVGAAYAAGQLDVLEERVRRLVWADVVRMFDPVWPRSGLLSGARAAEWLGELLGDWRIEDLAIPFAAVAVDLISGEEIILREGRVVDAIRASFSIPGLFVPHSHGSRALVDGAIRNPVPVSALSELGAEVNLGVNLHATPVREIVGRGPRLRPRSAVANRILDVVDERVGRFRRRSSRRKGEESTTGPNLFEVLTSSMTIIEHELARHRLAHDPVDVVLTPDVHGIRSFEFHKARSAIHAGEREAEARIPEIQNVLQRRRRPSRRSYASGSSSPESPTS